MLAWPAHAAGLPGATVAEPLLQGFFLGASLVPLLLGLALWAQRKDARLAAYSAAVLATTAFFATLAGLGAQPVAAQPGSPALAPALLHLLAASAACLFAGIETRRGTLSAHKAGPLGRGLLGASAAAAAAALLLAAGLLNGAVAHTLALALGLLAPLLALPGTQRLRRASDPAGHWSLHRGGPLTLCMLTLSAALQGGAALGLCSLPLAQFGTLLALTLGLAVLGERLKHDPGPALIRAISPQARRHSPAPADPHIDALTGALNADGLHAAAQDRLVSCTPQSPVAVLHAELAGFQAVCKTLGAQAGDTLLAAAAERLRTHLRGTDHVARLEGARFAVVLGPLSPELERDTRFIATKLQKAFEQPFSAGDTQCCLGLNLGAAFAPQHHRQLEGLLQQARLHTRTGSGLPSPSPALQTSG